MTDTGTLPLEVDLCGRIANMRLAQSNAMFALYEAVVNSIHAILDGPAPTKGVIKIRVIRGPGQHTTAGTVQPGPVLGFEIRDNGVGFGEENFASFRRSDSTIKAKYGGKGVGRLLWLKVFTAVKIDSVFEEGSKKQRRTFTFSKEGISDHALIDTGEGRETIVTIQHPTEQYRAALQHEPETIAVSTIEHCLEYFIADHKPSVFLSDQDGDYQVELGKLFQDDLKSEIKRDDFQVNGAQLRITHLLVRGRKNSRHALHFCANLRRVKDESLTGKIPGLSGGLRLPNTTEDLAYQGYLSGKLLDDAVDAGRASFDFDNLFVYDPAKPPDGSVNYENLVANAIAKAKNFLDPTLSPILQANEARIRGQIEATYPQYRYLLKHRASDIAAIPPGVEGRDLDFALYKIEQKHDGENREALNKELSATSDPDESPDERRTRLEKLLEQLNDSGMAKLARHVAYRRAVIEFLEDQLGLQSNGKYSLEEAVHAAVCPTKATSDDVASAKMNLWLLDDRLYFHYYLASDLPFKEMRETIQRESEDRPDLAIFHRPMAFSDSLDQIGAVVLVEFKRPVRDDFKMDDPDKNPVSQVLKYVNTLRSGEGRRVKGQAIHIRDNTPFYAYIVADFTKTLREIATREDFRPTPDGEGYFRFYQNFNCYVEMISFQKMIRDAKKRNQAFFDKLNIPMTG